MPIPRQTELFDRAPARERDGSHVSENLKVQKKPLKKAPAEEGNKDGASGAPFPAVSGERYLSVKDLCERYRVSPATIWRWTKTNPDFPQPVQLSPGGNSLDALLASGV